MKTLTLALLAALSFASAGTANAANETVTFYNTAGVAIQFCTDTNGVRPVAGGVYATGVTAGACVAPPVASCPATITMPDGTTRRLVTRASVSYGVYPAARYNLDITKWDNLYGYNNTTSPVVTFPGVGGSSPVIKGFPKDGYICAKIDVGSGTSTTGGDMHTTSIQTNGPRLMQSFSYIPGSFDAGLPTLGCLRSAFPSDSNLVFWKGTSNNPTGSCNFTMPTTQAIYVNITAETVPAANYVLATVSYSHK